MLAKLISYDTDRERARKKLLSCLKEFKLEGVLTNQQEQIEILSTKQFKSGKFGTSLYEELYGKKG